VIVIWKLERAQPSQHATKVLLFLVFMLRLRNHVRVLAAQIIRECERFQFLDEKEGLDFTEKEKKDYCWLLNQLSVFLMCYSLLDNFFHRLQRPNDAKSAESDQHKQKTFWPLVCFP
jgi:hypothetical protein